MGENGSGANDHERQGGPARSRATFNGCEIGVGHKLETADGDCTRTLAAKKSR